MRSFLRKHVRVVAGTAVVALGLSAGLAVATVPGNDGSVHGCLQVITIAGSGFVEPAPGSNFRVIDPEQPAGQTCDAVSERQMTIAVRGAQGPPGLAGAAGAPGQGGGGGCETTIGHFTLSGTPALSGDVCAARQTRLGITTGARAPSQEGTTEYELTRRVDATSPKLAKAAAKGTIFKSAKLQILSPAATFNLSNVAISSYQLGLGQEKPTETLTLIAVSKKGS